MANYIVKASPYCTINSTCYVAQVEYNGAPDVLIPVIKGASDPIPTREGDIINALESNAQHFDTSCTIETLKRNLAAHGMNLDTESI